MDYKIKIHIHSRIFEYHAAAGTNLLHFLLQNSYEMYAPCGGQGTCGKCIVKLGKDAGEHKLSCQTNIDRDMEVYLDGTAFQMKVLTEGKQNKRKLVPSVSKRFAALPPASIEDQRTDSRRLSDFLSLKNELDSLPLLRQLPQLLHENDFEATLVFNDKTLIGIEDGDTTQKLYGVAIDIGTTTIAAYLLNLITGEKLATHSNMNPQKKFGADVISRIQHTVENEDGGEELHGIIMDCINQMVIKLAESAGIESADIYELVFVGNTTMMHFLLKLPANYIAVAPFIPATTRALLLRASELGIRVNKNAIAVAVPSVAAYIGADTVSAVLASGMYKTKRLALLVDFGTNGEIVLGSSAALLACSAAAGPAFEGANIQQGVGGIRGAIDSFKIEEQCQYTTIGDAKPVGICGTGLVDIVSALYKAGIIDETGRIEKNPDRLEHLAPMLKDRITNIDGMTAFIVTYGNETANQKDIFVTQKDIRELQNAKAAIAAGIRVLGGRAGIRLCDIEKVYLAGGFGTYINPESALNIGLIPPELRGRLESIGNAAGIGGVEILTSRHALKKAQMIRNKIAYVELSSCKDFNDLFVDEMIFPENE